MNNLPDLIRYKAMIKDVGISCEKFFNQQHIATTNAFPWPVLLYNAKEKDDTAISLAKKNDVLTDPQFMALGPYDPKAPTQEQQQKFDLSKARVLATRDASGESKRAQAFALGHVQVGGLFRWEQTGQNQKRRFVYGTDCLYCGLGGHEIPGCPHFLAKYQLRKSAPYPGYQPQAGPLVGAQVPPAQAPLALAPLAQDFAVQGTFSGIATPSADGMSITIEITQAQFTGEYEQAFPGAYEQIDMAGGSLAQEVQDDDMVEDGEDMNMIDPDLRDL